MPNAADVMATVAASIVLVRLSPKCDGLVAPPSGFVAQCKPAIAIRKVEMRVRCELRVAAEACDPDEQARRQHIGPERPQGVRRGVGHARPDVGASG
jgi:hypothetical protein